MATSTYVLASTNVSPLILPERTGDMTVRYNIPYTVINTNGTSATGDTLLVSLGVTPASWTVQGAIAYISPAFAGVTSQAGTVSVGTTTNLTAFIASASMFTAGVLQPANGMNSVNVPTASLGTSAITLQAAIVNSTTGTLQTFTAGNLVIELAVIDPTLMS